MCYQSIHNFQPSPRSVLCDLWYRFEIIRTSSFNYFNSFENQSIKCPRFPYTNTYTRNGAKIRILFVISIEHTGFIPKQHLIESKTIRTWNQNPMDQKTHFIFHVKENKSTHRKLFRLTFVGKFEIRFVFRIYQFSKKSKENIWISQTHLHRFWRWKFKQGPGHFRGIHERQSKKLRTFFFFFRSSKTSIGQFHLKHFVYNRNFFIHNFFSGVLRKK